MSQRRHLSVIATSAEPERVPARTSGHWVLLGVLLVVATWLPLGVFGLWISRLTVRVLDWGFSPAVAASHGGGPSSVLAAVLPVLGSFALSAYLGGMVVIRFGSARSMSSALLTGGLSGALVASLAAAGGALHPWPVGVAAYITLILVGAIAGLGGGRRGRRLRNAATLTSTTQSD